MSGPSSLERIDFGGAEIEFDARVLRPRGWTLAQSLWVEEILPDLPPGRVLELCSGAGQIGLRGLWRSDRDLLCVDANPAALDLTAHNALRLGMADRVQVREGLLGEVLRPDEVFALIVADPPWLPRDQIHRFPEDPPLAIDGGADGLDVVRACLAEIDAHLMVGGAALLQLGTEEQAVLATEHLDPRRLRAGDLRLFERGVVLRLDRPTRP